MPVEHGHANAISSAEAENRCGELRLARHNDVRQALDRDSASYMTPLLHDDQCRIFACDFHILGEIKGFHHANPQM